MDIHNFVGVFSSFSSLIGRLGTARHLHLGQTLVNGRVVDQARLAQKLARLPAGADKVEGGAAGAVGAVGQCDAGVGG